MRKDTYRIGDGTFAFSPAVFDSLLGHGAKGAARMRELAGAMHVSISSIKDWRRGTHAPSDFEKVEDIACWAHIDVAEAAGVDVKTVKNWESPRLPRARATAVAWKYLENLAEIQEREVGCLVEKIVDETDGNPYPLPYFREQDLAAEDARAARISNAMTRKVAFELTRLAIPYEFRFEEEAADDERLSEIWDM